MAEATRTTRAPSLGGWIVRDLVLTTIAIGGLWGLAQWHAGAGSLFTLLLAPTFGFIAAYALCYIYHEWGHLVGANLAGARMPLAPYAGALIGSFDIRSHSRGQFLWLSWGGVLGYVLTLMAALVVHTSGRLGLAGAGFAVGALAFNVQSLSVDLPQIARVHRGADIAQTSAEGANARIILRRTWQSWSVLALALLAWNLLAA